MYAPESPTPPYNTGVAFYATVAEALLAAVVDPTQALYSVVFDLGLQRFVVGPGMQIQRALNASQNGDTVLVKAGIYVTQALIGKGIVLLIGGLFDLGIAQSAPTSNPGVAYYIDGQLIRPLHNQTVNEMIHPEAVEGIEALFDEIPASLRIRGLDGIPPGQHRPGRVRHG